MALTLKSVAQFASDLQQGIMGILSANPPSQQITDFSDASPAAALTETFAEQYGFLQNQAVAVENFARLGTCDDAGADSFVADYVPFGFTPRLGATYCVGPATFTRNLPATITTPPLLVGTIIQNPTPSPSAAIQYQVVADTTNPAYSANAGGPGIAGYQPAAGLTQFAQAPLVQALVAGAGSRVLAGTLTVIASPSVPFDTVTNAAAIVNGQNQESTPAMVARFAKWATGLGGGTQAVMGSQILGVQPGMTYTINDGLDQNGNPQVPLFTAVVDDGSGAIPAQTLANVTAAIDVKRTPGMPRKVIAPTDVPLQIAVTGTQIQAGFDPVATRAALQSAIIAYVMANGVGGANQTNNYTPSLKFAYVPLVNLVASFIGLGAAQGLAGYSGITLNGGTSDVALTTYQLATASAATVTVS